MITARVVGDDTVLAWLRAAPDAVASGLAGAITNLAIDLQRKIQEDELTGQVLAVRTGSLKSSIDLQIDQDSKGISATVSSDSEYAHVHEYGFAGTVDVRASLRRIIAAFGHPISEKTINVRAYRHRMDLPERSFMRQALEDMDPAIRDEVEAALREALTQ
jgi:phage gpG-like protein